MKTRINHKKETITLTINHDEATSIWLALYDYVDYLKARDYDASAKEVYEMYRKLLHESVRLGKIEEKNREA